MTTSKKATKGADQKGANNQVADQANSQTVNSQSEGSSNDAPSSENAPAAPAAPIATIMQTKKQPPLASGRRGGGRTKGTSQTYNFAEAAYNDITGFVRHIVNGCYVPTFNGMPGVEVDATKPTFNSVEEAHAAGAEIGFGFINKPHIIGYVQNRNLEDGLKTSKPEQKYHCFLTAKNEDDVKTAVKHINDFYAMPWNANTRKMVVVLETLKPTFPITPLQEVKNPALTEA